MVCWFFPPNKSEEKLLPNSESLKENIFLSGPRIHGQAYELSVQSARLFEVKILKKFQMPRWVLCTSQRNCSAVTCPDTKFKAQEKHSAFSGQWRWLFVCLFSAILDSVVNNNFVNIY